QKVYLRVGSANYAAKVWVNGRPIGKHEGGHLPFAFDITREVRLNAANRITIQTENLLSAERVPTGSAGGGSMYNNFPKTNYDFFPYGGLQRAVWLYSTPVNAITDVTIKTGINGDVGIVNIKIKKEGGIRGGKAILGDGKMRAEANFTFAGSEAEISINIPGARFWSPADPYLYQLEVNTGGDVYRSQVGIRTVAVTGKQLLLNGKPVFLKGFGKHEDFPVFGRGAAQPVMVKDYSLLKWVGANSFRTSHYPYDEEYMNMADREGILIIDETPAVGLFFDEHTSQAEERKKTCVRQVEEMIQRDKNHPSVIMWSLANEPLPRGINTEPGKKTAKDEFALRFFKDLFDIARKADDTRPVTLVALGGSPDEWLAPADVICINRYYGWYSQPGEIALGVKLFSAELDDLYKKFNKPVFVTEFGADTYPGMHAEQPEMFTEEYQQEFIKAYLDVGDSKDFVIGMHIWAFSDFKTTQATIRFGGINYKGVFTRDRKPKMAAHYLRKRWKGNG
ncbi:MAG: hypothetical protein JNM68_15025, partial [Dinghuibacter sp.]|nr:hypothetical protein [Dinghuibacter sp.]